ncbi:MAG: helix-turn-helix domain-containing protein [Solirubrobacterales bacterium]
MKVECRLKDVLTEHGLDHHGVIQEIAEAVGVNRHTIAKLYNDRAPAVTFALLGRLCNWLVKKGVPADELPGALLGAGRAPLWTAISRQGGAVTIYLGEYQLTRDNEVLWRWISRRDSSVAALIVQRLSAGTKGGSLPPPLGFEYIPFRYSPIDHIVDRQVLDEDIRRTQAVFDRVQHAANAGTTIIIGSQRVNYLLEFFVADLFGCRPFVSPSGKPSVPFFSVYRSSDQNTPSCFGGPENPFRSRDKTKPGLHYLNDRGQWETCPWLCDQQDAGIVVSLKDHRRGSLVLAIFGFSGWATEAIGGQMVLKEDLFWPPTVKLKTREVGVYVCQLTNIASAKDDADQGHIQTGACEVIPLGERTLANLLGR